MLAAISAVEAGGVVVLITFIFLSQYRKYHLYRLDTLQSQPQKFGCFIVAAGRIEGSCVTRSLIGAVL